VIALSSKPSDKPTKIRAGLERLEMAQSYKAMSENATYLRQVENLDTALDEMPSEEQDGWWKD
jgi:hypothetical protein